MASMGITVLTKNNKLTVAAGLALICQAPSIALVPNSEAAVTSAFPTRTMYFWSHHQMKSDDTVFQASPFLTLVHESPTFDANLDYTFDWYKYSDVDSTSKYHRGEASVTGKAWGIVSWRNLERDEARRLVIRTM